MSNNIEYLEIPRSSLNYLEMGMDIFDKLPQGDKENFIKILSERWKTAGVIIYTANPSSQEDIQEIARGLKGVGQALVTP